MRTHLRSAVLALALVSLAAVPAQAHSTSPPGASLQASVRELVTVQAFDITTAIPALVSADAWKLLQAPQVHAEHVTDVAHAIEASARTTQLQRSRSLTRPHLTSHGSRFNYALSKRPTLMPILIDTRTGLRFTPDGHAGG